MPTTNFSSGTVISSTWLNEVDATGTADNFICFKSIGGIWFEQYRNF